MKYSLLISGFATERSDTTRPQMLEVRRRAGILYTVESTDRGLVAHHDPYKKLIGEVRTPKKIARLDLFLTGYDSFLPFPHKKVGEAVDILDKRELKPGEVHRAFEGLKSMVDILGAGFGARNALLDHVLMYLDPLKEHETLLGFPTAGRVMKFVEHNWARGDEGFRRWLASSSTDVIRAVFHAVTTEGGDPWVKAERGRLLGLADGSALRVSSVDGGDVLTREVGDKQEFIALGAAKELRKQAEILAREYNERYFATPRRPEERPLVLTYKLLRSTWERAERAVIRARAMGLPVLQGSLIQLSRDCPGTMIPNDEQLALIEAKILGRRAAIPPPGPLLGAALNFTPDPKLTGLQNLERMVKRSPLLESVRPIIMLYLEAVRRRTVPMKNGHRVKPEQLDEDERKFYNLFFRSSEAETLLRVILFNWDRGDRGLETWMADNVNGAEAIAVFLAVKQTELIWVTSVEDEIEDHLEVQIAALPGGVFLRRTKGLQTGVTMLTYENQVTGEFEIVACGNDDKGKITAIAEKRAKQVKRTALPSFRQSEPHRSVQTDMLMSKLHQTLTAAGAA